jgi:hypothetical protein
VLRATEAGTDPKPEEVRGVKKAPVEIDIRTEAFTQSSCQIALALDGSNSLQMRSQRS